MDTLSQIPAAPSAATPAAGAAAAAPAAPSAPTNGKILSLADAAERALKSLTQQPEPAAQVPRGTATSAAGQEPSPAVETPAAGTDPNLQTPPAEPAAAVPETDEEETLTPEQEAGMSESEKRIYGALKKEREARKGAKAQAKELQGKLEELTAKVADLSKPKTPETPATPAPQPSGVLAEAKTPEEVDVQVTEANRIEMLTYDLQRALATNRDGVVATLTAEGVKDIGGKPLAECDDAVLGDFISAAYKGARTTISQAGSRKTFLAQQYQSIVAAAELIPGLKDPKSAEFAEFQRITKVNPQLKTMGPAWPEMVATFMLGQASRKAPAAAAPVTPPVPVKPIVVPPVPTRATPGAPTRSAAAIPPSNAVDEARSRIKSGKASLDDVQLVARSALS